MAPTAGRITFPGTGSSSQVQAKLKVAVMVSPGLLPSSWMFHTLTQDSKPLYLVLAGKESGLNSSVGLYRVAPIGVQIVFDLFQSVRLHETDQLML